MPSTYQICRHRETEVVDKPRKKKSKSNGNTYASAPFTAIPNGLLLSPELNAVSASSQRIYMIMLTKWLPYDQDKPFILTYEEIIKTTNYSSTTISKAIKELMVGGFIEIPVHGGYPKNVSQYRINHEWLSRKYPKKRRTLPEYMKQFEDARDNG